MTRTVQKQQNQPSNSITACESVLSETQALTEATRCLQCFNPPCTLNCPASVPVPSFIRMIRSGNFRGAAEQFRTANPLSFSCGFSCPDDELCASACTRGKLDSPVAIRRLHRFATDFEIEHKPRLPKPVTSRRGRIAIVGAGPAGLACASELKRFGYSTTIFEQQRRPGGVPAELIPLERLPGNVIRRDISRIIDSKSVKTKPVAKLKSNHRITNLSKLCAGYDAVFVAPGLSISASTIPGSELRGVISAYDFLRRCRRRGYRAAIGERTVIIGGGNVAVDAASAVAVCARNSGISPLPDIRLLYRRTRDQMPAWTREIRAAEELGVSIEFLLSPISFVGNSSKLTGIKLCRNTLGPADSGGRPTAVPVAGSEFILPCDQVISALGQQVDRSGLPGLPITGGGDIKANARTLRVKGNLFAGGDATGSDQTIVAAVSDGKRAARSISAMLGKIYS